MVLRQATRGGRSTALAVYYLGAWILLKPLVCREVFSVNRDAVLLQAHGGAFADHLAQGFGGGHFSASGLLHHRTALLIAARNAGHSLGSRLVLPP